MANSASIWKTLNIYEDGGTNSGTVTSINPTGVEGLTFTAGNNIDLSFDTTDGKKLKIEMGNNISDISSLTVDGEGGIKVKNGNSSHGFVEFYENMIMEKIKLKFKERTYRRYHTYTPKYIGKSYIFWRYRDSFFKICYQQAVLQLVIMVHQQQFQ